MAKIESSVMCSAKQKKESHEGLSEAVRTGFERTM